MKDFFYRHISEIKNNKHKCSECGDYLLGDFSEVAHILPKSKFKSIATLDKNIIYLCGWKSENNCHGKYDNCSNKDLRNMIIFPKILKSFDELCDLIEEKITYKDYDRWQV